MSSKEAPPAYRKSGVDAHGCFGQSEALRLRLSYRQVSLPPSPHSGHDVWNRSTITSPMASRSSGKKHGSPSQTGLVGSMSRFWHVCFALLLPADIDTILTRLQRSYAGDYVGFVLLLMGFILVRPVPSCLFASPKAHSLIFIPRSKPLRSPSIACSPSMTSPSRTLTPRLSASQSVRAHLFP